MIEARVSQFKLVLALSIILAISLLGYAIWAIVDFNSRHALAESQFLTKYTDRAISRYRANPSHFLHANKQLGNERVNVAIGYEKLKQLFPYVPDKEQLIVNKTQAILVSYRGFFKVPNYLLVRPVVVDGRDFYSYLLVDERLNDSSLDWRALEKVQPAIFVALICILLMVIVELFHISRVNTSINEFARWANQLSTGAHLPPMPEFSSSKFNYLAFAIDKSLSGISHMLEQEQSFAKFTSHELRTPIAVLSANMELLELLMKDLSPQERNVLKNMESAVSDMKYQMDALLWLSREGDLTVDLTPCSLGELINKALDDNAYLLNGKSVTLNIDVDNVVIETNPVFVQIIVNNLVRNAYQHTDAGRIVIQLHGNQFVIENQNNTQGVDAKKSVGFGIGLALVEKLIRKLGVKYEIQKLPHGRRVTVTF